MTSFSPYEISKNIGDTFGRVQERSSDLSAIDEILQQASESDDPNALDFMSQQLVSRVTPERRADAEKIINGKRERIETQRKEEIQERQFQQKQQLERDKWKAKEQKDEALRQQYIDAGLDPNLMNMPAGVQTQQIKAKLAQEDFKGAQKAAKEAIEAIKKLTPLVGMYNSVTGFAGKETQEALAEFTSSLGLIESRFNEMVNKGNLSDRRFGYILSLLPSPYDTQATIRGKIKGLERDLRLLEIEYRDNANSANPQAMLKNKSDDIEQFKF